jgi:hypothetical protein
MPHCLLLAICCLNQENDRDLVLVMNAASRRGGISATWIAVNLDKIA